MRPGSEYERALKTEGKYVETALIQLTEINDQFILYSSMVVYNFFYNVYIFFKQREPSLVAWSKISWYDWNQFYYMPLLTKINVELDILFPW